MIQEFLFKPTIQQISQAYFSFSTAFHLPNLPVI